MPAPATSSEFLEFVLKSGVVEEARLKAYTAKQSEASGKLPEPPSQLADRMIQDGLITQFQADHLLQGKWKRFKLGKYKVLDKLGTGGMGTVFLCEHMLMKRRVAVKVLPAAKAKDESALQRFYREARAVAAVDHPNIVRAYDIDEDDGLHFLVMEYVDGTNLQDLVKRHGPLDIRRACHYIYGAAIGLHHANSMGLVHRDIKPANILVDRSGVVKILDMGLARFFNPDEDDNLTKKFDENILGTADYLAPEQAIDSTAVDIRADLYGLGGTFYFLLTGSAPFPDGTVAQKLLAHQSKEPRPIEQLRPGVPPELVLLIQRLMAKDPAERVQSPEELITLLSAYVQTPIAPPTDLEMPAPLPGAPGNRGPGATSTSLSGSPTSVTFVQPAVASGSGSDVLRAGKAPFVPAALSPSTSQDLLIYDSPAAAVAGETRTNQHDHTNETDDEPANREPRKYRRKKPQKSSSMTVILIVAVVGLLLFGGAGVAALLYFKPWASSEQTNPASEHHRWVVSQSPVEGVDPALVKKTLTDAIAAALPGDVIAIADPRLEMIPVRLSGEAKKNIRIESANPGQPAVLVMKPEINTRQLCLIEIASARGVVLAGLTLEIEGRLDFGIGLVGKCPDVKLENVHVKNPKTAGIRLQNLAGDPEQPVLLHQVRVSSAKPIDSAIWFFSNSTQVPNAHIRIDRSRLEGPAKFGFRLDGLVQATTISQTKIHNVEVGVQMGQGFTADLDYTLSLDRCTFHANKASAIQLVSGLKGIKQEISLTGCYFAKSGEIAKAADPSKPLKLGKNARDAATREGNLPTESATFPKLPDLNADPAHADFLKIPPGSPLAAFGAE